MTAIPQGRIHRAALLSAACALAATGTMALTGCSSEDPDAGTNGVGKLSADKIQSQAKTAAGTVEAVRLSGTVVTSGHSYRLDMRLKPDAGIGSVTSEGATFHVLRIGRQLYLKADAGFWNNAGGKRRDAAAAGKLGGKYVKVPPGDPVYKKFSGFTDKTVLLDGLLTLHGKLAVDGHHDQSGTPVIRITGDNGSGGTLDVSLEGKPYPLRLVRGGGAGTLGFADWGKEFAVSQPPRNETVDYGEQLPAS